ncbi:hypothetical protein Hdeb2414_s0019g00547311 [Helianthus debilis subsp. tardiflorus]
MLSGLNFTFIFCAKCFRLVQNMDLKFISTHNQAGYLAAPPAKHRELYTSLIKGLNSCRLVHALRENPVVYENLVQAFWKTARFDALGAEGKGALIAEIEKKPITVTEQMIREVLQFNDQETDPIELPAGTVELILPSLSYEGKYPPLVKKFVHPYWRLLMIFNARYPDLVRSGDTLELKPMGPACFGALTPKKGTEKKFEGLIPLEKFGQFAETEEVAADPVIVQPMPVNAMVAEEHDVQGAVADEPETEILTINSDDEGIEIMCDSGDDEELPPENEAEAAVSTVPPMITAENLALLLKSVTDKIGNPPSDLTVSHEGPRENPRDPDSLPLKRKRKDPRLGMYVKQSKDQPVCTAEEDDGLFDFDFEKNVTDTTTTTEDIFYFNADSQGNVLETATADVQVSNVDVDTDVDTMASSVSDSAGPSRVYLDMPSSSSGKKPEEPFRMPLDDSSDDDEFISLREMKKRLMVVEQDSIYKDAKILQLEDTLVQKNRQIEQLQGDVSLLFNMVYDLRGKLEKKFGNEFSNPTDVQNRREAFAKDDAERSAAMEKYFERVIDPVAEKEKAKRIKKKREFVILKNKNLNPDDDDAQATHHLTDVGETLYDKVGNRSGVVSWGFDHDRKRWWIKRKIGPVEWYKAPAQFQTFTKIDLTNLANAPYVDDKPGGRGHLFCKRLKREVLAQNQIRATEKYEEIAKGWTAAVASAIHIPTKGFGGLKDRLGGARED